MAWYFRTGIGPFRYSARLSPSTRYYTLCGVRHRSRETMARCRECVRLAELRMAEQQAEARRQVEAAARQAAGRRAWLAGLSPEDRARVTDRQARRERRREWLRTDGVAVLLAFLGALVVIGLLAWGWLAMGPA